MAYLQFLHVRLFILYFLLIFVSWWRGVRLVVSFHSEDLGIWYTLSGFQGSIFTH